ncbi:hypothetical protein NNO_0078 [Hydrogenimonas sp.]|nr:hypothetical protein NNO_0078 [Hydrogenimonas sp.]
MEVSAHLVEHFGGEVPRRRRGQIRGHRPKAAHIILETAFGENGRRRYTCSPILNLWGFIETSTPEESLKAVKERLSPDEQSG